MLRNSKIYLKRLYLDGVLSVKNRIYKPNKGALFIFGFQKSGTTAIAGLLAKKANKSVTLDTKYLWPPYLEMLQSGGLTLEHVVNTYCYPFSKQIIKEPNLTIFIDELHNIFTLAKYIFIVRNPYENIRSLLNRLQIPGNLDYVDLKTVHPNWRHFFKSNGNNYVQDIANRWVAVNGQKKFIESSRCILVRYEDFLKDKNSYVHQLAVDVGFEPKKDIVKRLDHQFQPKGNVNVDPKAFFGKRNYQIIENTCGHLVEYYGY